MKNILVIDNIDSFVYNLVQYVGEEGCNPIVLENTVSFENVKGVVEKENIDGIIISPGPKGPKDAGISNDIIREFAGKIPILGVCLGHQCIGHVFGGKIRPAKTLKHGKSSKISHRGTGLLKGLPNPFEAIRYHSLVVDDTTLPKELEVVAISNDDREIMALKHVDYPVFGLQFHPESILTEHGHTIIQNFLKL
jgi:anthranilate synthase component II